MDEQRYTELVSTFTQKPPQEKCTWFTNAKLCVIYIEFRDLQIIETNLYNLCNVYGGDDVALCIIHSEVNKKNIHRITGEWKNVKYMIPFEDNINIDQYNSLLCSYNFWNNFSNFEHVLINQWDSYIFKKIPKTFFDYDYVGAPCSHFYVIYGGNVMNICSSKCKCPRCITTPGHPFVDKNFTNDNHRIYMFNGGFSLRRVSVMKMICQFKKWSGEPEDVYFCLNNINKPTREEACKFAIQDYANTNDTPVGVHQIWKHQDYDYVNCLFNDQSKFL